MNVIALVVHGTRLSAFSERADSILMEDAAAEVVSLAASHGSRLALRLAGTTTGVRVAALHHFNRAGRWRW